MGTPAAAHARCHALATIVRHICREHAGQVEEQVQDEVRHDVQVTCDDRCTAWLEKWVPDVNVDPTMLEAVGCRSTRLAPCRRESRHDAIVSIYWCMVGTQASIYGNFHRCAWVRPRKKRSSLSYRYVHMGFLTATMDEGGVVVSARTWPQIHIPCPRLF